MNSQDVTSVFLMSYCILFCGMGIAEIILGEMCFGVRFYVVGIVITIVSILGLEAVHKRKPKQLLIFGVVNVSTGIIVLLLSVLIMAIPVSYGLNELIMKKYTNMFEQYYQDESARSIVDFFQEKLKCCGIGGIWDYEINNIPKSCYHNSCPYRKGCIILVTNYVKKWFYILNAVSLFLGTLWTVVGALALYLRGTFNKILTSNV